MDNAVRAATEREYRWVTTGDLIPFRADADADDSERSAVRPVTADPSRAETILCNGETTSSSARTRAHGEIVGDGQVAHLVHDCRSAILALCLFPKRPYMSME